MLANEMNKLASKSRNENNDFNKQWEEMQERIKEYATNGENKCPMVYGKIRGFKMENRLFSYNVGKVLITFNYSELINNNMFYNSIYKYLIKDYNTKEKIKVDLYNKLIDDFKFENRKLGQDFYDMLDLMLDNLCEELKEV